MLARHPVLAAPLAVALVFGAAFAPRDLALLIAVVLVVVVAAAIGLSRGVTAMFVAGALLLDFSPLAVYRYFLVSDLLIVCGCLVQFVIDRRVMIYVPTLATILFAGYVAALLGAFAISASFQGVPTWLHFAFLMLVYVPLVTTLFVRRPDLKTALAWAIVVTAVVQSLILFVEVARGLEWRTGTRVSGALGTSALWPYVAAVVALTGGLLTAGWRRRIVSLVALAIIGTAEMLLRSRMLWLSSFLGAFFMCSLYGGRRWKGLVFVAAIVGVVTIGYVGEWYPAAIQLRIAETLRPTETRDLVARMRAVSDLSGAIEASNGMGIGLGQSASYLLEHHSTAPVVNVHNIVMHAAVEGGVIAAVCLILLPIAIVVLWIAAARLYPDPSRDLLLNWEVATLGAIYIGAQLTPTLFEHTFYVMLAALAASAVRVGAPAFRSVSDRMLGSVSRRTAASPT